MRMGRGEFNSSPHSHRRFYHHTHLALTSLPFLLIIRPKVQGMFQPTHVYIVSLLSISTLTIHSLYALTFYFTYLIIFLGIFTSTNPQHSNPFFIHSSTHPLLYKHRRCSLTITQCPFLRDVWSPFHQLRGPRVTHQLAFLPGAQVPGGRAQGDHVELPDCGRREIKK